jgi:ABC-2 type transport system permease protein
MSDRSPSLSSLPATGASPKTSGGPNVSVNRMLTSDPFWLPILSLWRREVVRFVRQRSRIVGALATPVVFWLLIGAGLGRSFTVDPKSASAGASMSYLEYFFPGTVVLIVLFTAIFSTISIIEDRREGFLQGVIAAPVGRSAIVIGKVLGSMTLALFQALLFLIAAPLAGVPLDWSSAITLVGVLALIGAGLSALGFLIAWPLDSTQGFHAIMNLFLVPMWLLSGALFPRTGASTWIGWVMAINPLTYGVAAVRRTLYDDPHAAVSSLPSMVVCLVVTSGFAVVAILLCAVAVARRPSA